MASSSTAIQAEAFPDGTKDYVPLRKRNYDIKKPRKPPPPPRRFSESPAIVC